MRNAGENRWFWDVRQLPYLLPRTDVRDREVEPQTMSIVVRVRPYLNIVFVFAQLSHLPDIATCTAAPSCHQIRGKRIANII